MLILKNMYWYLKASMKNEKGQGMVEYSLIIALIAVVIIAAFAILTPGINDIFQDVANSLTNPSTATTTSGT